MTKYFTGTLKEYNSPGWIKQIPTIKRRNPVGGLLIPTTCIGAAYRHSNKPNWEKGIKGNYQVRVKITSQSNQLTLTPWPDAGYK